MTNWNEIDRCAKSWIAEAAARIKASFYQNLNIETKSNRNDLVTSVDRDIEQFFIQKINDTFPAHQILGEEGYGNELNELAGTVWIIDPIDGTMNFIHQKRNFAISIGVFQDGVGQLGYIYDVVHNELYHARKGHGAFLNFEPLPLLNEVKVSEAIVGINAIWLIENNHLDPMLLAPLVKDVRGTRSYGSAALEIAYIATGRMDAYLTPRLSPWDIAGGLVILEEVGGIATTLKGEPLNLLAKNSVFVSKPGLHEEIMQKYLHNGNW